MSQHSDNKASCTGVTLLEVLVVLSVITILASLLLPAIGAAREEARRLSCASRERQLALGLELHVNAFGHYPSDGWGWSWAGDNTKGRGREQPGGWIFATLPYIEQNDVYLQCGPRRQKPFEVAIPLLYCPSRRAAQLYPYTLTALPLVNADLPIHSGKNDYAICAGDRIIGVMGGPPSDSPEDIENYEWWPRDEATGISFVRTQFRPRDIHDGMPYQIALSEKSLSIRFYTNGKSLGDDQSPLIGDDADIRRWTEYRPIRDSLIDDIERFGSAHPTGLNVAFCDGSVRFISYQIEHRVFRNYGNRADGESIRED